jgi:hypothetical protein
MAYSQRPDGSEHIPDQTRAPMSQTEQLSFERLKAELATAFAASEDSYGYLTADDVIVRHSG